MAVAEISNLSIEKGTDFGGSVRVMSADEASVIISGITSSYARIRKHSKSVVYEEFNSVSLASTGVLTLTLSSDRSSGLESGRNYFDVVFVVNNKKTKVAKGTMIVWESMSV